MKAKLVKLVRRLMPARLVRWLEEVYRRSRLKLLDQKYGHPAAGLKVIAITGTNGKTTTANYLNSILKQAGLTTAMFSTAAVEMAGERQANTLNATIPTTEQLLKFFKQAKDKQVDYVLIEATSHALDQHKFPELDLELAIFTNLTQDHLDYHKTMASYLKAKQKLWDMHPRFGIVNLDDEHADDFLHLPASKNLSYGQSQAADLQFKIVDISKTKMDLELTHGTQNLNLTTSLAGEFNAYNVAAASLAAIVLGVKPEQIKQGIASLKQLDGRLERVKNQRQLDIVVDYAHTPDALERLLKYAKQTSANKVHLVFGSCGDRDQAKRPIMGKIAAKLADYVYVTDEENYTENADQIRQMIMKGVNQVKNPKATEIADRRAAIKAALKQAKAGDTVLVTGMGHEQFRIVDGKKIPWNDRQEIEKLLK